MNQGDKEINIKLQDNNKERIKHQSPKDIQVENKNKQEKDLSKKVQKKIPDKPHGGSRDKVTMGLSNDENAIGGPDVFSPHFPDQS